MIKEMGEMGFLPIRGENPDGCICIYREEQEDGHCINKGHPVCEKHHPVKRTLFIVRLTPAHA